MLADWTLPEWLGVFGFGLAVVSLGWQVHESRIRVQLDLFLGRPNKQTVVVECHNKNKKTAVEVRYVAVRSVAGQGLELSPQFWRSEPRIPPLGLFQANISADRLRRNSMTFPVEARAIIRLADGKERKSRKRKLDPPHAGTSDATGQ